MNEMNLPGPPLDYAAPTTVDGYPGPTSDTDHRGALSIEGMHGSVALPKHDAGFWKQWRAFVGPALLISVGYMDPGNWGTDLSAGAQFKYGLLWVVGVASLMAIFLQVISARLGVVTGKDLAQCCRDWYPKWSRWPNWLMSEVAIGACDLAEVLGSAVAINLLTHNHIHMLPAVLITAADVFLLLALQRFGMRTIEAVILVLVATIGVCYFIEIFVLPPTPPGFLEMGSAMFRPSLSQTGMIYVAIGIIGATVMPHNLYLHSALVQSRQLQKDHASIKRAIKFNTIDSTIALSIAFFVNAAILVLAAMVFFGKDSVTVGGQIVTFDANTDWIRDGYKTLEPLLGTAAASVLFAVALLASGQSSTITGTLAGQVVMEGFMHWRVSPWIRRLITRSLAILPAVLIIGLRGDSSINDLLNLSQVVLALQLPFAMFPLLHFTSSRKRMGAWRMGWFLLVAGWSSAVLITTMDAYGLDDALNQAWQVISGGQRTNVEIFRFLPFPLIIAGAFHMAENFHMAEKSSGRKPSKATMAGVWILSVIVPFVFLWLSVLVFRGGKLLVFHGGSNLAVTPIDRLLVSNSSISLSGAQYIGDVFFRMLGTMVGILFVAFLLRAIREASSRGKLPNSE